MKLKDALENYYFHSGKVSEISRNLCFAGIAVVWIFTKTGADGSVSVPAGLIWSLILFVSSLILDLCHYIYSTVAWGWFHREKEKLGIKQEADVFASAWINRAALVFFAGKVVITIIGYGFLFMFLANKLS